MTVCVYRCFDAAGTCLYVGQSSSPMSRLAYHKCNSVWWSDVSEMRVTFHSSRADALTEEACEITALKPAFNIRGNPSGRKESRRKVTMDGPLGGWVGNGGGVMAVSGILGVSRPYLYGLLDGTRQPSLEVAQRIARATDGAVPITAWPNIAAILEAAKAA